MTTEKLVADHAGADWLLDPDRSIRWQVMRDLTDGRPNAIAAESALVAREGWGRCPLASASSPV